MTVRVLSAAMLAAAFALPGTAMAGCALPDSCQSTQNVVDPDGERDGKAAKKKVRRTDEDRNTAPRVKEQSETSTHSILDLFRIVSI